MSENRTTRAWQLYERGRDYNQRLSPSQYDLVDTNTEFFAGNQWRGLPNTPAMRALPKPTFNILKRIASLFIASLTSSGITLRFEPLAYYGLPEEPAEPTATPEGETDQTAAADFANAEIANLWEKFKMDYRVRDALFDGAQTGDYCAHFWFDPEALPHGGALGGPRGEIRMELVDGINVMFGNPNSPDVQRQPYILLVGRDTVENLRAEARRYARPGADPREAGEADSLTADWENDLFPGEGGKVELEPDDETGKALFVLLYTKERREDGETTVRVTKATRTATIYENVDTGLSLYPIAWGNWERQKNQYHGRALITGLIPNQIFINRMFATAMRHLQLMAFPKVVYNADLIPAWTDEVGQAIAIRGLAPGQSVGEVAYTLPANEMSGQIFALIDKVMGYTKDCLGATDAQMGNVRPDNTSALMVLQTNAEVPLENIRAGLYEWCEDVGHILLDLCGTYYGRRPVVVEQEIEEPATDAAGQPMLDPTTGMLMTRRVKRKAVKVYDFSQFKHLWLNLRVDAGATTYFSEIAMTQTLDNLRRDGVLTVTEYLERLPDKLLPRKAELIEAIRDREARETVEAGAADAGGPTQGGPLDAARAVSGLPAQAESRYSRLPLNAQRTALTQAAKRLQ